MSDHLDLAPILRRHEQSMQSGEWLDLSGSDACVDFHAHTQEDVQALAGEVVRLRRVIAEVAEEMLPHDIGWEKLRTAIGIKGDDDD